MLWNTDSDSRAAGSSRAKFAASGATAGAAGAADGARLPELMRDMVVRNSSSTKAAELCDESKNVTPSLIYN